MESICAISSSFLPRGLPAQATGLTQRKVSASPRLVAAESQRGGVKIPRDDHQLPQQFALHGAPFADVDVGDEREQRELAVTTENRN
jgi:hypothetical protein